MCAKTNRRWFLLFEICCFLRSRVILRLDRRIAHGKSEGPANYIHHIDHVLEDTEQFCVNVKQISPTLPHIAIG
jgi:hypothetical protein